MTNIQPYDGGDDDGEAAFIARATALGEQIEAVTAPIGLYMQGFHVHTDSEDPSGHAVVVADFMIGDLAFRERVQHPSVDKDNTGTRVKLAEAGFDDDGMGEAIAEQWKRKLGDDSGSDDAGPEGDA